MTTTRRLVRTLLERPDRPTCILLPDDSCFFGALEAARGIGLRVPEDVSMAGYDGVRLTQSLHPRLTTIEQDAVKMGKEAARRLVDRIEHPNTASSDPVTIPVKLLEGATIAPPAR